MNVLIVCNPYSGRGKGVKFAKKIQNEINKEKIHTAEIFLSENIEELGNFFTSIKNENPNKFDALIILGGDGSLGIGVTQMLKNGLNIPVGIFPLGTVNDFAKQIGVKRNVKRFVKIVLANKIKDCDVAKVRNEYAVNVVCGGYFTHGANTYSRIAKKIFGKITYYFKAFFNVFNLKPQKLRFEIDGDVFEEEVIMYLVLNSKSAGGFKQIGKQAKLNDGLFDVCVIKKCGILKLIFTALNILRGKHIGKKSILYQSGKNIKIQLVGEKENPKFLNCDMDGNVGQKLPIEINVHEKKIQVFCNK